MNGRMNKQTNERAYERLVQTPRKPGWLNAAAIHQDFAQNCFAAAAAGTVPGAASAKASCIKGALCSSCSTRCVLQHLFHRLLSCSLFGVLVTTRPYALARLTLGHVDHISCERESALVSKPDFSPADNCQANYTIDLIMVCDLHMQCRYFW